MPSDNIPYTAQTRLAPVTALVILLGQAPIMHV